MNGALLSSKKMDWQTPECVLERVRMIAPIGLDPCTTDDNPVRAARFYVPATDGLSSPWPVGRHGLAYVNPPYGRELGRWVEKCVHEASLGYEIVLLCPARPDTKWWRRIYETADAVRFWNGRIRFVGAEQGAPVPIALSYWGERAKRFHAAFADVSIDSGLRR